MRFSARVCSQKVSVIFQRAAFFAMIKFATEPSKVRFLAKVDDDAYLSKAGVGLLIL